ncbi:MULTISPECIES: hypothetical protein [Serratia]|nr:hypothetical protein [Serratia marcescens]
MPLVAWALVNNFLIFNVVLGNDDYVTMLITPATADIWVISRH